MIIRHIYIIILPLVLGLFFIISSFSQGKVLYVAHSLISLNCNTSSTNTAESKKNKTTIFPNPSSGVFTVKTQSKINKVTDLNLTEKVIATQNSNTFIMNNQPKGFYMFNTTCPYSYIISYINPPIFSLPQLKKDLRLSLCMKLTNGLLHKRKI